MFSVLIAAPLLLAAGSVQGTTVDPVVGTWTNPKRSIEVRTRRCGERLCGTIVGATPRAIEKARKAGVTTLIGTELFSDYLPAGGGDWAGRLFVPDKGRSFSSRLAAQSGQALKVSGCLVGRILCKSQVWTRTDRALAKR